MSICKWSQKVCQELLKIFEDHYLDRNFFFLRPDYTDYCRSRGRGRTWGCAAPCCYTVWWTWKEATNLAFPRFCLDPLPVCPSQEGRQRRKEGTCISLRVSGARGDGEKTVDHVPRTVGTGGQSFPSLQNTSHITVISHFGGKLWAAFHDFT